jgi:DNA polymerase III subunit delta
VPPTNPADVARALARGRRGGIFFLWGEDEYRREELTASIVSAHLDPATRDFNYDQLRGSDVEPETLLSMCATPPMMAEWRVVVVRDVQALGANARGRAVLEKLLDLPVTGLALVLSAQLAERASGKIYDRLKKGTVSVHLAPLGMSDLPAWLIERAESEGVTLEPEAARALASANPELGVLAQELKKLVGYVADRARITREDVLEIVGSVPAQNRWDWFDMVGEARFAEARAALPVLLQGSETGVGLIIGLGTHLLRIALAVTGGEKALQGALPGNQRWLAGRVARQAKAWTARHVDAALDDLLRADRLLKSASLTDTQVLEELLLRLQARTSAAAAA